MEFRILGPIELIDGDRLVAVGGPRQRALLAVLLVHANRLVPVGQLVEEVWEHVPPAAARSLQVYVSRLRKALGREGERLATRSGGYVLRVAPDELDAHRFERQLLAGRRALAAGDPERASQILRDALALWRGRVLADVRGRLFAQMEIGRLEELRVAAVEERIDADLARGRHREIVPELQALVAEHPLRERVRCQLMLALYRSDRQADALDISREGRRRLNEQLGLDPSPSLCRLERAILTRRVEPPSPSGAVAMPLPGALRALTALPFVGRSVELECLRRLWAQSMGGVQRLLLVEGEAGAGKTRLARELALEAAASGAAVMYGACDSALSSPYQPFVEALARIVH